MKPLTAARRVSIIGAGHVGSTLAFSMIAHGACDEIVLVNRTHKKAEGEAADLQHAAAFVTSPISVRAGTIEETAESQVIAITVGGNAKSATRLAFAEENARLIRELVPQLVKHSPDAVLLVITNPVDAMTFLAWQASGLPASRVLGTGTLIDSARFRSYLSQQLNIHPDDIRAYVLGEHGDTQFPALSIAVTGGQRIDRSAQIDEAFRQTIASAYEIYSIKGYTNYAVAMAARMIIEAVLNNSRRTMPISTLMQGYQGVNDVCLSVPAVVGREGVVRALHPDMSAEEIVQFQLSAAAVRAVIDSVATE